MKLNILSDLHLGISELDRPLNDADVVVLAGDVGPPRQAALWAMRFDRPVVYVLGNHEFYGGSIAGTAAELKRLCAGTQVHVLDNEELVIGGVRFLGTTLWSDFMLFGPGPVRAAAMEHAQRAMRDFSRIRIDATDSALFTPQDAAALFERHAGWLQRELDLPHDGPTVVVSHHAPSRQSIHPRFADSPLNACFVSDAEHLVRPDRVQLWIHGHTHDSFDYQLGDTRVVCNPRGYAKAGVNENPLFDPDLVIDVGPRATRERSRDVIASRTGRAQRPVIEFNGSAE
jgi:predicted phosphodiesterase